MCEQQREHTVKTKMEEKEQPDADDADSLPPNSSSQANLSDLVKEIVKEMDGDDFYSKPDLYDESTEVKGGGSQCARIYFVAQS